MSFATFIYLQCLSEGGKIGLAPFSSQGVYQLQESPLPDGSLWVARSNVLQQVSRFSTHAISELEELINTRAWETSFQDFFQRNPEFLLALGPYKKIHPQLILHKEDGGRLIPDLFLEKINSDFCDICDLKRSTAQLIRYQHNRYRFRDAVMEGVAQLDYYRNWFEDRENREIFFQRYGLRAYRPRVVLIIGRRQSYYDEIAAMRIEDTLPRWVDIRTYDEIVERARFWNVAHTLA